MSRNNDGTFAKGNKFKQKKDFTKEMAKDMVSKELWFLSQMITNMPESEIDRYIETQTGGLSLLGNKIIKAIRKGDVKTAQWFVEMMIGRPSQQVEHSNHEGKSFGLNYNPNGTK